MFGSGQVVGIQCSCVGGLELGSCVGGLGNLGREMRSSELGSHVGGWGTLGRWRDAQVKS